MRLLKLSLLPLLLLAASAPAGFFYPDGTTTLHFAFEGSPNGDRPIVRPPGTYYPDDGYGFVDSPGLIGTSSGVTAPKYFRFDANIPPGNYDVTVRMGGGPAGNVTIRSEAHRVMVYNIDLAARGNATATFTVNVRGGSATEKSLDLDNRLTLEFSGTNPSMMKLDIKPSTAPTLWILGDEWATDHEDLPHTGWGQMLPLFFKPGEIAVATLPADPQTLADSVKEMHKGDTMLFANQAGSVHVVPDNVGQEILKRGIQVLQINASIATNDAEKSPFTAFENAKLVATAIRDSKSPLAAHLYDNIPAPNSDPAKFPPALGYPYLQK